MADKEFFKLFQNLKDRVKENERLKQKLAEIRRQYRIAQKMTRKEVKIELEKYKKERDEAVKESTKWRAIEIEARRISRNVQRQLDDLKEQLSKVVAEYNDKLLIESKKVENLIDDNHMLHTEVQELQQQGEAMMKMIQYQRKTQETCAQMIERTGEMIEDASEHLNKADAMMFQLTLPKEITDCIVFCKSLVDQIRR